MRKITKVSTVEICGVGGCQWEASRHGGLEQHEMQHEDFMKLRNGQGISVFTRDDRRDGIIIKLEYPAVKESSYKVPYVLVEFSDKTRSWFSMMDVAFPGVTYKTFYNFD